MPFEFSKRNLSPEDARRQRLLEILPGLTSWGILLGMTALSFFRPMTAAVIIIAFDFYWLLRLLYMTIFLLLAYLRLTIERETDWIGRIRGIDILDRHLKTLSDAGPGALPKRLSFHIHRKELTALKDSGHLPPPSGEIFHLVIFPVAKEPREVLEPAIASLTRQNFPLQQIVVVYALEERAPEATKKDVADLTAKYQNTFFDLLTVVHPADLPGEARVKGANATYAAQKAALHFEKKGIPFENIIVSCFDADTVVGQQYFSCLTYYFMITPHRTRASFQPIPVYHNNIWDVPGFARIMESGSSFFQLVEATHPEKLVTFSSHSMSFKALVDVGYWPVDMISDDSAIFWKAFIHYDGKYRVVPMYVTLSMDVAASDTWWRTAKNIYKQKRRWAWGVENFPIVARAFLKSRDIPSYEKFRHAFKLFEGHVSWATWGFILTIIGWLPTIFAGQQFRHSVVYYNMPQITGTIFHLASLSLIISVTLSIALLPKTKLRYRWIKKVIFALEWCAMPLILVFLSALPALDAQTRLLLGRHMEFWVTDKKRKDKKDHQATLPPAVQT